MAAPALRVAVLAPVLLWTACSLDPVQHEVLTCEAPELDTTQWREVTAATYRFHVPAAFTLGADNRWESGRAWVRPGVIAPGEFESEPPERLLDFHECRAIVGGRDMLLQYGVTSVSSRFGPGIYMAANWGTLQVPPPGTSGLLVMEAWTPSETDFEVFWSIFWSMVVTS
ncbi:MAG: hypothetical protein ACREL7_17565 [Longimicrobiales bacterium]